MNIIIGLAIGSVIGWLLWSEWNFWRYHRVEAAEKKRAFTQYAKAVNDQIEDVWVPVGPKVLSRYRNATLVYENRHGSSVGPKMWQWHLEEKIIMDETFDAATWVTEFEKGAK